MGSMQGDQPALDNLPVTPAGEAGMTPMRSPQAEAVIALDDRFGINILALARLVDGGLVFASGVLSYAVQFGGVSLPPGHLFLIGFQALLVVNLFQLGRLYSGARALAGRRHVVLAPLGLLLGMAAVPVMFAAAGEIATLPWAWLLRWAVAGAALVVIGRVGLAVTARGLLHSARFARRVLVVGDPARARSVISLLAERGQGRHRLVGVLVDRGPALTSAGLAATGRLDDIEQVMRMHKVDDIVVVLPWSDENRMAACMARLRQFPVDVHLFPDDPQPLAASRGVALLHGVPLLRLSIRPLGGSDAVLKAAEDKLLGGLAVLLLAPLMILIAIAIRLESPGPVIFRQKRYGYNNEVFTVYKFRSMYTQRGTDGVKQATRRDPRITRVGAILRRTSLDELPQFFNVLNGTMSLVGPRPHAVEHQNYYQHLVDEYRCRHRMKPGITGWAQINGLRGETSDLALMQKRVELDLYYIDNWSVMLDLWILLATPLACLRATNAY